MPSIALQTSNFFSFSLNSVMVILINTILYGGLIYLLVLLVRALRKYLRSNTPAESEDHASVNLGASLKSHRLRRKMTQEFVAEKLNVSRQAVSKWENGTADPSTANLLALAKLYEISPEELLKQKD